MSPVKVTARTDLPEAKLSTFSLEGQKEGEVFELPRWVAEVLEENALIEKSEEGVESELFRALQREKLQGPSRLSQLSNDIYLRLRRHLMMMKKKGINDSHYEKVKVNTEDLITMRLVKMVTLAGYTSQPEPTSLLSPEERLLFKEIKTLINQWRSLVMGGD